MHKNLTGKASFVGRGKPLWWPSETLHSVQRATTTDGSYLFRCLIGSKLKLFRFGWLAWLTLLSLNLLLAACGADSPASPDPKAVQTQPTASATSVGANNAINSAEQSRLEQASKAFDQLQSLRLALQIRQGKLEVGGAEVKQVEGDLQQPDKYQVDVKVQILVASFKIPVIGVGGEQYMKNELGSWNRSKPEDTLNLAILLDKQVGLGSTLLKMQSLQLMGREGLQGVNTIHLKGQLTGREVAPLTLNKLGKRDVTLEIWISEDNPQIQQLSIQEIGADPALWVFNFSKFNQVIQIQKPKT